MSQSRFDSNTGIYSVYMLIFPGGELYIGSTSKKPSYRCRRGTQYNYQPKVKALIDKYGWDAVRQVVVGQFNNRVEAAALERQLTLENRDRVVNTKNLSESNYAKWKFKKYWTEGDN